MKEYDVVIVGGGVAGIAAAIKVKSDGIDSVLLLESEGYLGGILNQCIHNGFGSEIFQKELTGPEYAERLISKLKKINVEYKLNTTVFDFNKDRVLTIVNEEEGIVHIKAKSVIFATGCKERPRGVINIAGSKSAGIYTAGMAQKFINLEGFLPGKEVVIIGSGNVALIMARRFVLEGANVKAIIEINSKVEGCKKYVEECIEDFNISLKLGYTVLSIKGKERVEGIEICKVDKNKQIIENKEEYIECNTVILSVNLIPEKRLLIKAGIKISSKTLGPEVNSSMETDLKGIFACGDLVCVHNNIDYVTNEGYKAGESAANYIKNL